VVRLDWRPASDGAAYSLILVNRPGNARLDLFASWKMMPSVWRLPDLIRLTPCRRIDPIRPLGALHGPIVHGERHASPWRSGTTSTRSAYAVFVRQRELAAVNRDPAPKAESPLGWKGEIAVES